MAPPLVSVVVPVHNGESYLRESLDSVLAPGHVALEVIVVDDGSTDRSAAAAERSGPRVEVHRRQRAGAGAARNHGVRVARGAYLAFLYFVSMFVAAAFGATSAVAPEASAAPRDKAFFQSVAGSWKGPGEIVAGKYKGTKFNCNLTGEATPNGETGIKLDGTCRVGVFKQPMSALITQNGKGYKGKFLDGADHGSQRLADFVGDGRGKPA